MSTPRIASRVYERHEVPLTPAAACHLKSRALFLATFGLEAWGEANQIDKWDVTALRQLAEELDEILHKAPVSC